MKIRKVYCKRAPAFKMKTWIQDKATNSTNSTLKN